MKTLNLCEMLADTCLLKIEKAGKKHDYEAALAGKPKPKYVVKNRHPTYDMAVFDGLPDMQKWLEKYHEEFKKFNEKIAAKRQEDFKSELNGND